MFFFFSFLGAVVSVGADKGRAAFINNRGIHSLCEVISKQIFQYEDATDLMLSLLSVRGHLCWSYHSAFDDFNSLMGKLCTDFANSQVILLYISNFSRTVFYKVKNNTYRFFAKKFDVLQ